MAFSMITKRKATCEHSDLFDRLNVFFGGKMNLVRIMFCLVLSIKNRGKKNKKRLFREKMKGK